MTEKTLTTENIRPALDALRGELAPWPVVAKKQDRLNTAQLNAANSGITSSLVAQIIANTAAIRALESAITGTGLRALVVASLPAVGITGILYIVPVTTYDPDTDADVVNYSNEYIWIPVEGGQASEGHYEQVGQTGIVINNGQLTITVNGTSVGTFTANQSGDTTAAITVPTNADYVDRTTDQTVAGVKTFSSTIIGTAAKAIADEDGTSIKTGYVNVAGNQTVSGDKSFTGSNTFSNILPNATNTYSLGSSSYRWSLVYAGTYYGYTMYFESMSERVIRFQTNGSNNYKNFDTYIGTAYTQFDNTVAMHRSVGRRGDTTTGATIKDVDTSFSFFKAHINYKSFDLVNAVKATNDGTENSLKPITTNATDLGTSTNQWSSVYAQTYYYKGTAWGLDKANVWSDVQFFSKNLILTRNVNVGTIPSSSVSAGFKLENANATYQFAGVTGEVNTNGVTFVYLSATNNFSNGALDPSGTARTRGLQIGLRRDGSGFLYTDCGWRNNLIPHPADTDLNLGTSTNKWKTLNGVDPGALSLPDFTSETGVSLSAGANTYTPVLSGWLSISTTGDISVVCGNFCHKATDMISVPVIAGKTYTVTMPSAATGYFYSCQGNV